LFNKGDVGQKYYVVIQG